MNQEAPWQAWCDGAALPNPGRLGLGALLIAPDGSEHRLSETSTHRGCNNEAEARALLATLHRAHALGATWLQVYSDSDVVVRLAQDAHSQEARRLAPLFDEIRTAICAFARLELRWLPQHRNTIADQLARAALGMPPREAPKPVRKRR